MSFVVNTVNTIVVHTPAEARAEAARLKAYGQLDGERPLDETHLAHLKSKLLGHEVLPFDWAVGLVPDMGIARRVNGQHSSEILLRLTAQEWEQIRFPLYIHWTEYTCETVRSLPILFENFDEPWMVRRPAHIIGAHLALYDVLKHLDRTLATRLSAGIQWYYTRMEGLKGEATRRFKILHEADIRDTQVHPYLVWCQSFLKVRNHADLLSTPVIAAMYHSTLPGGGGDVAKAFWEKLSLGEWANGPTADNPTETIVYKLIGFLEKVGAKNKAEWPATILKHFTGDHKRPTECDIFATCLRSVKSHTDGRIIREVFEPAKKRKVKDLVDALYPLTLAHAA